MSSRYNHFFLLVLLIYLSIVPQIFCDKSEPVNVEIDPLVGTIEDSFRLSITIEGEVKEQPYLPVIDGLDITSSGQSSNFSWINGKSSRQTIYHFDLFPQKSGRYTIPSLEIKLSDKNITTKPLVFEVAQTGMPSATSVPSSQEAGNQTSKTKEDMPDVFITRQFSKNPSYEGEVILVKTKIYFRIQIHNPSRIDVKSSDFRMFDRGQTQDQEVYNGITYRVINLEEALVSLHYGRFQLPPFKLSFDVLKQETNPQKKRRNNSPLDDLFSDFFDEGRGRFVKRTVSSSEDTLDILPLPASDASKNFSGAVGKFDLKTDLPCSSLKTGDTCTLTVTVEGLGLLDGALGPILNLPETVKVYEDKPSLEENKNAPTGVFSKKIHKYALVPTKPGSFSLSQVEFNFFDPASGTYQAIIKDLPNLEVSKASEQDTQAASLETKNQDKKQKVETISKDLVDLIREEKLLTKLFPSEFSFFLHILLIGSFLFYFLSFCYYKKQKKIIDPLLYKQSRAYKNYRKQLKKLSHLNLIEEKLRCFKCYLGDKFGFNGASLTTKDLITELDKRIDDESLKQKTFAMIKEIEKKTYQDSFSYSRSDISWDTLIDEMVHHLEKNYYNASNR